jgi:hypothetical protein
MKTSQISGLVILIAGSLLIITAGCNQRTATIGKIPYNEDSVKPHILPIARAVEYTGNFRAARDSFYSQRPAMKIAFNFGSAEAFNKDAIAVLLNQKDAAGNQAAGLRIYYGLDKGGLVRMVLVPYDSKGNDIINQLVGERAVSIPGIPSANAAGTDGQTIENGQRCPPVCSSTSSGLSGY